MNNALKMVLVLLLVCLFSAVSLSFLYVKTQPKIEQNKLLKEVKLKKQIIPSAEKFVSKQFKDISVEKCYDEKDNLVGFLVKSGCRGYAGEIEYIVSVSPYLPLKITGIKIVSHKETPGLGANVTKEKFLSQFLGKTSTEVVLKKDDVNGKIDAISGATITSLAVTRSLKTLLENEEIQSFVKETIEPQVVQQPKKLMMSQQRTGQKINISTSTYNIKQEQTE
jgi:electron transport complex protein RnfG